VELILRIRREGEEMSDTVHTVRKTLRLRPEEAKMLEQNAKLAGFSEAEYLRFLLSQKPKDYPEIRTLLKDLINEVNHIGVNVNQIVFHHNASLYSQGDKELLLAYMKKMNGVVGEVVIRIGNL
jgi:hypothetical protein